MRSPTNPASDKKQEESSPHPLVHLRLVFEAVHLVTGPFEKVLANFPVERATS